MTVETDSIRRSAAQSMALLDGERGVGWGELPDTDRTERLRISQQAQAKLIQLLALQLDDLFRAMASMQGESRRPPMEGQDRGTR